jgi:leucyl aminopeptidase
LVEGKGREGGACTAAAFLKAFIDDNVKWAHVDIAGPAMFSTDRGYVPKGGTGFGVGLVCAFLEGQEKK